MKILMLGWELPPHHSGGLGVACFNLARALAREGAEIDFVVPYLGDHQIDFMRVVPALRLDPLFRYGGGAYDSKHIEEKRFRVEQGSRKMSIRDVQREYCEFVANWLEDTCPDVIHMHDWLTFEAGMIAKRRFGVPLVAHVHATEYDRSGMNGGNPLIHEIEKEGLLMADQILAVSESTKRIIHEKYGIPLEKIDVAYNSLSTDFAEADLKPDLGAYEYLESLKKQGYTIVATMGRLTIQKGMWHLLHAAARALKKEPKLMFVLAGDGEERDSLLRLAAELGITRNVIFTGWVSGERRRNIYSAADIFVMSSVSEPFGLTALEAAHYGDVLILTKQSGVAEVLHTALTYDFWDDARLANQMVAVARSQGLQKLLRKGILREYRQISWQDVARKCIATYKKAKHARH